MARGNDGTVDRYVDLGDLSSAKFDADVDWTFLCFFRVNQISTDDNAIIGKWTGASTQFLIRTDNTASGNAPMEVWFDGGLKRTGGTNIAVDTWYMVAVSNSGAGNNMLLYLYDMGGAALDDALASSSADDADQTSVVLLGARDANDDNIDGELAHAAYIDKTMSKGEIEQYLWSPARAVAKHITAGVQFYLPLGLGSTEPDFSGSGNTGTVTGAMTVEDNPPVAPWYGLESEWQGAFTTAAVAITGGELVAAATSFDNRPHKPDTIFIPF